MLIPPASRPHRHVGVCLNYERLRPATTPDETEAGGHWLVEMLGESVVLTPRARRPFGDSIADYNPLGHFGLAWTAFR
jgi:hypothetical protein